MNEKNTDVTHVNMNVYPCWSGFVGFGRNVCSEARLIILDFIILLYGSSWNQLFLRPPSRSFPFSFFFICIPAIEIIRKENRLRPKRENGMNCRTPKQKNPGIFDYWTLLLCLPSQHISQMLLCFSSKFVFSFSTTSLYCSFIFDFSCTSK